jgi:outer membrane protein
MIRPRYLATLWCGLAAALQLQAAPAVRPLTAVLDDYVRLGLADNLQLRRSQLQVDTAVAELDAARARYLPELGLSARYTRNTGGREFDFATPAGNLNFPLLRPREQDSALTLQQPLYVPAVPAAVRAQRAQLDAQQYARQALTLRLRRDITTAYLRWLQAERTIEIVRSTQALLAENLRVNEALFSNGRITQDQVLRARAEQLAVEQQSRQAANSATQAQSYLNFLLNRALDVPLESAEADSELRRAHAELATLRAAAIGRRAELAASQSGIRAAEARAGVARASAFPSLVLAASGGTQGERYEFGRGRNYSTISLLLNWNLFDGGRRHAEASAARLAAQQLRIQDEELRRQIELEVQQALDDVLATEDWLATSQARVEAASAGFRIAARKRDEGAISQAEFLDARNTLTSAELNLNLTRFELLAKQAELDYATAASAPRPE